MKEDKLTPKQQLFVEAYLGEANGNGTKAARLAGYKGNDKTLGVIATENLSKPSIASRVRERLTEATKGMNADEVLSELAKIARMDADHPDPKAVQNKVRALELLGKYHKLFTEKQEITGKDGGAIETQVRVIMPMDSE